MTSGHVPDWVARIDALLPQTQCTRCGFAGCEPYAAAIAAGEAAINQCPPGGQATIRSLAALLDLAEIPLNPANGRESAPTLAWIDETRCIGCARCLAPCPVDAIVGAPKFLHTVVAELCTGCELCLVHCPVDCIELRPSTSEPIPAAQNRERFYEHNARIEARAMRRRQQLEEKKAAALHRSTP